MFGKVVVFMLCECSCGVEVEEICVVLVVYDGDWDVVCVVLGISKMMLWWWL